jgi:hypothetical protein
MSVIAPYDRDALRERFRAAQPFPWLAIDGFLDPDFANELAASYPSYEDAVKNGRAFAAVNENLKVQVCDYEAFPAPAKRIADALCETKFLEDLSYVTGVKKLVWDPTFSGGGLHETARSGWLDVHVDFNYLEPLQLHRRLNILVYLNPIWEEQWGGVLELWDDEVKTRHHAFAPVHNRCVLFETSDISYHGVSAVECPAGIARKSFAAYYYTREAPAGWDGSKRSTVFKARPDEYMKRHLLMPAEAAGQSLRDGVRSAKDIVKRMLNR